MKFVLIAGSAFVLSCVGCAAKMTTPDGESADVALALETRDPSVAANSEDSLGDAFACDGAPLSIDTLSQMFHDGTWKVELGDVNIDTSARSVNALGVKGSWHSFAPMQWTYSYKDVNDVPFTSQQRSLAFDRTTLLLTLGERNGAVALQLDLLNRERVPSIAYWNDSSFLNAPPGHFESCSVTVGSADVTCDPLQRTWVNWLHRSFDGRTGPRLTADATHRDEPAGRPAWTLTGKVTDRCVSLTHVGPGFEEGLGEVEVRTVVFRRYR